MLCRGREGEEGWLFRLGSLVDLLGGILMKLHFNICLF